MKSPATLSMIISITFASLTWGVLGYTSLKSKFPGKGLKVIKNVFKKTTPFDEAINALQEGKRIRRKSSSKGFTRIIVTESKNVTEKYGTYWASYDEKSISEYCNFSIEDVLATDWIIDE